MVCPTKYREWREIEIEREREEREREREREKEYSEGRTVGIHASIGMVLALKPPARLVTVYIRMSCIVFLVAWCKDRLT